METAIAVGRNGSAAFDPRPAPISPTREAGFLLLLDSLSGVRDGQWVQIQETGFARRALFRDQHPDAERFCFLREYLSKPRVRTGDTFLGVLLPRFSAGFPERILAQNQHSHPLGSQHIDDPRASGVQSVHHAPIALRRDPIEAARGLSWLFLSGKVFPERLALLVREVLHCLPRLLETRRGVKPNVFELRAASTAMPTSRATNRFGSRPQAGCSLTAETTSRTE